jgi:hypothetical protein
MQTFGYLFGVQSIILGKLMDQTVLFVIIAHLIPPDIALIIVDIGSASQDPGSRR